ncbi:MAG: glycosyltransferase family 39 protein [Prevotellaceae bacterium]|jgi:4-amino-4-deoxy-L-arabinose transferase-like glycosyltransferase|nr:glycosyltransferase family 39 protein [Prevotellaceae bacterium]
MQTQKTLFWLLAILSVLVILPFLGETIFYSKGEPREAIVAYTMLESGNWTLPLNYGADMAFKPPFLYWCIALFSSLSGGVSEYTSRLPSALSFLAMLWVVYAFFAKRKGVKVAFLTALLLLTSFEVHRAAVACRLDMLQVSLMVIAMIGLFRWDEKQCRGIPWLPILLMAAASLTKGPVGSLFPCLVMGVYQLLRGRRFWSAFFPLVAIGLASLVPLALWYWAAYHQGGEAFAALMQEENTNRFLSKMSYASHENPLWYNFLTIIWGWIPWTIVLLFSLFCLKWKRPHLPVQWGETLRRGWMRFRGQSPVQLFTWVVILVIFIFYCIPKSKRSVYLLPIYPFMALLIADYLLAMVRRSVKLFRLSTMLFASLCLLLTLTFLSVRLGWIPESVFGSGRHAAENIAFMHALQTTSFSIPQWLLIALPVIAALSAWSSLRKRAGAYTLLYGLVGCVLCLFVALDGVYQPTVLAVKSDKHLAARIREQVPTGVVYSYLSSFYCVNYYLHDAMRHFTAEHPTEGYVVLPERDNDRFLKEYAHTYQLEEIFLTTRRSCDLRDEIYLYKFIRK